MLSQQKDMPLSLHYIHYFQYPVSQPKHPAGKYPIQDHWSSNSEYLTSNPKDLTFPFCQVMYKKNLIFVYPGGEIFSPHGLYTYLGYLMQLQLLLKYRLF